MTIAVVLVFSAASLFAAEERNETPPANNPVASEVPSVVVEKTQPPVEVEVRTAPIGNDMEMRMTTTHNPKTNQTIQFMSTGPTR